MFTKWSTKEQIAKVQIRDQETEVRDGQTSVVKWAWFRVSKDCQASEGRLSLDKSSLWGTTWTILRRDYWVNYDIHVKTHWTYTHFTIDNRLGVCSRISHCSGTAPTPKQPQRWGFISLPIFSEISIPVFVSLNLVLWNTLISQKHKAPCGMSSSSYRHDRATVRSGAGTPQVPCPVSAVVQVPNRCPWQLSGVAQKSAYWALGSGFPRVRH